MPNVHVPQITRNFEDKIKYSACMTDNIKIFISQHDFLKKKVVKTGSENMFVAYRKAQNQLNNIIMKLLNQCYK